jgi:hypothetical protein
MTKIWVELGQTLDGRLCRCRGFGIRVMKHRYGFFQYEMGFEKWPVWKIPSNLSSAHILLMINGVPEVHPALEAIR